MSNKQQETELNKDQLSNGARSGSTSCDVQCFRQEPQKAILSRAVGHHTLAKSTALKWGMGQNGTSAPNCLDGAFFDQNLLFFVMSCQGVEQGAVD